MYIHQSDNYYLFCPILLHSGLLHFIQSTCYWLLYLVSHSSHWIIFLSRYYMFQFSLCSHIGSLSYGSAGYLNHSVLDFKDPFNYLVQWLWHLTYTKQEQNICCTHCWVIPGTGQSIVPCQYCRTVVILTSTGQFWHTSNHLPNHVTMLEEVSTPAVEL